MKVTHGNTCIKEVLFMELHQNLSKNLEEVCKNLVRPLGKASYSTN